MPGVGFIGGELSILGGYSWPGAVDLVERWDEDREEWVRRSNNSLTTYVLPSSLLFNVYLQLSQNQVRSVQPRYDHCAGRHVPQLQTGLDRPRHRWMCTNLRIKSHNVDITRSLTQ